MKIKLGKDNKYILNTDRQNIWIEQILTVRDPETGERKDTPVRVTGYCSTYETLLKSFLSKKIRNDDADKITKHIKNIKNIEGTLYDLAERLGKELDEQERAMYEDEHQTVNKK